MVSIAIQPDTYIPLLSSVSQGDEISVRERAFDAGALLKGSFPVGQGQFSYG